MTGSHYYIKSRWGYFRADARVSAPRWTRDAGQAYRGVWDDAGATQVAINRAGDGNTYLERVA